MGAGARSSWGKTPKCGSSDDSLCEADLPKDLLDLLRAVNQAAFDIRVAEAEHACRLAALARASARRRARQGLTAMEACAQALGVARSTLTAFAALAARWQPEDLRTIFRRRDCRGRAVSVSQLLLISRLPRSARQRCMQRVFEEGLSVRELREEIAGTGGAANEQEELGDEEQDVAQVV